MSIALDRAIDAERPALLGLAYRMLGTVADAEDAVQEAFVRWYRLDDAARALIVAPGAWLMRATSRICLDVLGSARVRREQYVGEWLPEPVPAGSDLVLSAASLRGREDPLEKVALDDSVSTALLLLLESLTPAERVVFVLHEVFAVPFDEIAEIVERTPAACRQLAASARRHLRDGRSRPTDRAQHDALVQAFAAACLSGDLAGIVSVLDPDVVLRADGGGIVSAARRAVRGADAVARMLLGLVSKWPDAVIEPVFTPDGLAITARQGGEITTVINVGVDGAGVTDVWVMRNPEKLRFWA